MRRGGDVQNPDYRQFVQQRLHPDGKVMHSRVTIRIPSRTMAPPCR